MAKRRLTPLTVFGPPSLEVGGGLLVPGRGEDLYVSTYEGRNDQDGRSWDKPLATMAEALERAKTHDRIFFAGKVAEQITIADITDLNLKFDITIVGCGSLHHADQPDSTAFNGRGYDYGAAIWQPAASAESATPLLGVYGRGWKFLNFMVDAPSDAAAFLLQRNAESGTSEYDPSHAVFYNVRAVDGKYFIEDNGGCYNVTVEKCEGKGMSTAWIANTSTSVANPLNWKIVNNRLPANVSSFGNATHIDSPLNASYIEGNLVGTVTSTALYIDLTGGNGNIVTKNLLMGSYDTSDYVAGTGDNWSGNITADISGNSSVDASGITIAAPAAP